MTKVRITADQLLQVIQGVFNDNDIDIVENSGTSISLQEALNIEYYSFSYRPQSSEQILADLKDDGKDTDELLSLKRSFACFSINDVDRVFNKDVDSLACDCVVDYWIQVDKLKLLEQQIDRATRLLNGRRIPVTFTQDGQTVTRYAVIILSPISGIEMDFNSPIGDSASLSVGVTIYLNPKVASWVDYSVSFSWINDTDNILVTSEPIPLNNLNITNSMNANSVPTATNTLSTGSVNLSRSITYDLNFDGFDNAFINYLVTNSLTGASTIDNNKMFNITITRLSESVTNQVVINSHSVTVTADTTSENHRLTLTTRGVVDASTAI